VKEDLQVVSHPTRTHETRDYREICLIIDIEPEFIPDVDHKESDEVKPTWYNLGL
jgi:hypothetical protein